MQWQKAFLIKKNYHTQTLVAQGFASRGAPGHAGNKKPRREAGLEAGFLLDSC